MNYVKNWTFASENCAIKGRLLLKIEKLKDTYAGEAYLNNIRLTSVAAFSQQELLKKIDSNLNIFYSELALSLGKLR